MDMLTATIIYRNGDTVIFNKGDDAHIKALVSAEIKRNQKIYNDKKEWEEFRMQNKNKALMDHINKIHNITPPPSLPKRIANGIIDSIGFVYACLLVWSEQLGLIEYIGEDKEWR